MVNVVATNPMVLDSTGTVTYPIPGATLIINKILWRGSEMGQTLTLTLDGTAVTREGIPGETIDVLENEKPVDITSFVVTRIDGGAVEVWLE